MSIEAQVASMAITPESLNVLIHAVHLGESIGVLAELTIALVAIEGITLLHYTKLLANPELSVEKQNALVIAKEVLGIDGLQRERIKFRIVAVITTITFLLAVYSLFCLAFPSIVPWNYNMLFLFSFSGFVLACGITIDAYIFKQKYIKSLNPLKLKDQEDFREQ